MGSNLQQANGPDLLQMSAPKTPCRTLKAPLPRAATPSMSHRGGPDAPLRTRPKVWTQPDSGRGELGRSSWLDRHLAWLGVLLSSA